MIDPEYSRDVLPATDETAELDALDRARATAPEDVRKTLDSRRQHAAETRRAVALDIERTLPMSHPAIAELFSAIDLHEERNSELRQDVASLLDGIHKEGIDSETTEGKLRSIIRSLVTMSIAQCDHIDEMASTMRQLVKALTR